MDKYDIKKELERLLTELKNSNKKPSLWDDDIKELILELKHTMHASGNICPRCNGSGTI